MLKGCVNRLAARDESYRRLTGHIEADDKLDAAKKERLLGDLTKLESTLGRIEEVCVHEFAAAANRPWTERVQAAGQTPEILGRTGDGGIIL